MPGWSNSDRRKELPPDWTKRRQRVLYRDGSRCTHRSYDNVRCDEIATEVDHINPGADHSPENLRSLCSFHHAKKSGAEGGAAAQAIRKRNAKKFDRQEKHPGEL